MSLQNIEEIETRLFEIINDITIEVIEYDPVRRTIHICLSEDRARKYEDELNKIINKYCNKFPSDHPQFLCGNEKAKLQLFAIVRFLSTPPEKISPRYAFDDLYSVN